MAANTATHEDRYLRLVADHLGDLPGNTARGLLASAREHLDERPPADSLGALIDDLGTPRAYAQALREGDGLPARYPLTRRILGAPRWALVAGAAGVVVVAAASGAYLWWIGLDGGLSNSCSGLRDPDRPGDQVPIEEREARGQTEVSVSYVPGGRFGIVVCLSADREVTITDVAVTGATEDGMLVPDDPALYLDAQVRGTSADTVPFEPYDPGTTRAVHLLFRFDNCEHNSAGGGQGYGRATVSYELLGRAHTAEVDLGRAYVIESPPDELCPERDVRGSALSP